MKIRAALTQTHNVYPLSVGPGEVQPDQFDAIRKANVRHHVHLIRAAHRAGVQAVGLGELFHAPYPAITQKVNEQWGDFAEDAEEGPTISAIKGITRECAMVVVAPIFESSTSGKRYNTAVVVDNGSVVGKCRKTHIPHGRNERGYFTEGHYYGPSDDPFQNAGKTEVLVVPHPLVPAFETSVGRIGVNICYGRHFPEVWRILRDKDVKLVFSPAITFGDTSERLWRHEFPVAAGIGGYFIGASNRAGKDFNTPDAPTFFGKSYFVGPDAKRLPNLSSDPHLVISELDLDRAGTDPSGWQLKANERTDI